MSDSIGHLSIHGDFDAVEITKVLGIEPSSTTPRGTLYEGAAFPSPAEECELDCSDNCSMSEQIAELLKRLWPVKQTIKTLSTRYTADFNIAGQGDEVLSLKPETLQQIAELGVALHCFFTFQSNYAN